MMAKPSKQAMRGKGGRADAIDTAEGKAKRDAALANVVGRKVRVVRQPVVRSGANDNVMLQLEKLIEQKLLDAADVLRRMPYGKLGRPSGGAAVWPGIVRDYWESAQYVVTDVPRVYPSAQEIDGAIDLMTQLSKLTDRERKVLSAKAFGFSYRQLGKEFRCSHEKIRSEHKQALLVFAMIVQISV